MKTNYYKTSLKSSYLDMIFLAHYYRWSAKFGAAGQRSPIDGKQYGMHREEVHDIAHRKASLALAKSYLESAREYRKNKMINIFTSDVYFYLSV